MKINLLDVQNIIDGSFDCEHLCLENPLPAEYRILHCVSIEETPQDKWQLHNFWFACQELVDMGEASAVGEIISKSMLGVMFCPFCGKKLTNEAQATGTAR